MEPKLLLLVLAALVVMGIVLTATPVGIQHLLILLLTAVEAVIKSAAVAVVARWP
jgi:hypothetical protein